MKIQHIIHKKVARGRGPDLRRPEGDRPVAVGATCCGCGRRCRRDQAAPCGTRRLERGLFAAVEAIEEVLLVIDIGRRRDGLGDLIIHQRTRIRVVVDPRDMGDFVSEGIFHVVGAAPDRAAAGCRAMELAAGIARRIIEKVLLMMMSAKAK